MKFVLLALLLTACARPPNWMKEPPEGKMFLVKRVDARTWSAVDHGYRIQVAPGCRPDTDAKVLRAKITPLWSLKFYDHGGGRGTRCPMTMMYPKPEPGALRTPWKR